MPKLISELPKKGEEAYDFLQKENNLNVTESLPDNTVRQYFDENQMIYTREKNKAFYTDNVNECIVTVLYNNDGELFAVHSNPASIPEFPKIIEKNFLNKDDLKVAFIGGKFLPQNKLIAHNTLGCIINSLNESGREIEVAFCSLGTAKSVLVSFDDEGVSIIPALTDQFIATYEESAMKSWNKLRATHCMADKEKYAWKPENNVCIWAKKGNEILEPQIPQEFLTKVISKYNDLTEVEKISLRDVRSHADSKEIATRFYKEIVNSEPRSNNDLDLVIDLFNGIERGIIKPVNPNPSTSLQNIEALDLAISKEKVEANKEEKSWVEKMENRKLSTLKGGIKEI